MKLERREEAISVTVQALKHGLQLLWSQRHLSLQPLAYRIHKHTPVQWWYSYEAKPLTPNILKAFGHTCKSLLVMKPLFSLSHSPNSSLAFFIVSCGVLKAELLGEGLAPLPDVGVLNLGLRGDAWPLP